MKLFNKILIALIVSTVFLSSSISVSAYNKSETTMEDFGSIIEDGIERKIRFVSEEDYYKDNTNDFLIIDATLSEKSSYELINSLSFSGNDIKLIIAGAVAGILANEIWVFVGGGAITQAMFAKGVATLAAAGFSIPMILVLGVSLLLLTSSEAKVPIAQNSGGCVWSGISAHQGYWLCPMKYNNG